MHRLQRQMNRDSRWDSAIDRLEIKYGLHLDDWKRLGRDQMGQKCGRGWVGLRGACERGKKSDDNTEKIKKSKRALADKIRARKGLRDRNAPKVAAPLSPELSKPIKMYERRFASIFGMDEELKTLQANLDRVSAKKESKSSAQSKVRISKEIAKIKRTRDQRRATLIETDIGGKSVKVTAAGQDPDGSTFAIVQMNGKERGSRIGANLRIMDGVVENIPPAMHPETVHFSKEAHDHLKNHGPELQEFADFVSRAIPTGVGRDLNPVVRDEIKARERAQSDEYTRLSEIAYEARQLNKSKRSDSDDSTHFDAAEITRYARAIASLNDRYGWHIDAQKVLSKLGKKLGKKCGKGWISPEKKCKSHYTNGKLNESGKASGENLADRIRQRKKLSTVSRDGKGKELAYAFLPGNQKQSTMTARRTHAPRSGYQTPGRLSNVNNTEERRSMVGLGRNPGTRSKPDNAPMMDIPARPASAPIESRTRKLNTPAPRSTAGDRIRAVAKTLEDESRIQKGATVGILKSAEKLYVNQNKMIGEVATMVNEDLDRASGVATISKARAMGGTTAKQPVAQLADGSLMMRRHSERQAKAQAKVFFPQGFDLAAVPEAWEGKTYIPAHWLAQQAMANAPVRIPNQRSSSEPRKRGRSVD